MADLNTKIKAFIDEWGIKVQQSANDILTDTVDYSTGQAPKLTGSIDTKVSINPDGSVRWVLLMDNYWQFIEFGVDGTEKSQGSKFKFKSGGKPIPQSAMLNFIDKRDIRVKLKTGLKGKTKTLAIEKQNKSLAFLLGRSIKKHGIKPRPFRNEIITPELKKELYDGLREIYKQEIIATFNED